MRNIIIVCLINVVAFSAVLATVMTKRKEEPKVKVVLPNDWKRITKFEGDPSLLSAYVRNDSLFLNFEAY
jgi:hypothetical protein